MKAIFAIFSYFWQKGGFMFQKNVEHVKGDTMAAWLLTMSELFIDTTLPKIT